MDGRFQFHDTAEPDFYGELRQACWNILHENPGTECGDWISMLMEQYPLEVVDALGNNPLEVFSELEYWWESMEYHDEVTGECHTFREWAEYFATERSVELFDKLSEARSEIKLF